VTWAGAKAETDMKTLICLILDRSGSMSGRESDVINGANGFIDKQKALPDPASIALVRFDSEGIERFRAMAPLAECAPITEEDYQPRGGTPLLDAVGQTILALEGDWRREQPERAIVVIVTDGLENASREYTKAKVKELIEARQASGKWAFIYLGANVDAFAEGGALGIAAANTAGYVNSAAGLRATYNSASLSVSHMRTTGQTLAHNLGGNINEDGSVTQRPKDGAQAEPEEPRSSIPPASQAGSTTWTPPK
jgi:uncharacterized protein YegL